MGLFDLLILLVCGVLIAIPPRFDPAIRWKEKNEARREQEE